MSLEASLYSCHFSPITQLHYGPWASRFGVIAVNHGFAPPFLVPVSPLEWLRIGHKLIFCLQSKKQFGCPNGWTTCKKYDKQSSGLSTGVLLTHLVLRFFLMGTWPILMLFTTELWNSILNPKFLKVMAKMEQDMFERVRIWTVNSNSVTLLLSLFVTKWSSPCQLAFNFGSKSSQVAMKSMHVSLPIEEQQVLAKFQVIPLSRLEDSFASPKTFLPYQLQNFLL